MSASEKKAKNGQVGSLLPNMASLKTDKEQSEISLLAIFLCTSSKIYKCSLNEHTPVQFHSPDGWRHLRMVPAIDVKDP